MHADFHAASWNLPFAVEFAACRAKLPIFATFISNSRFFGLLFNFSIYKTTESNRCKLWFCVLAPCQSLTQDNLRAHCAVFNNSNLFSLYVIFLPLVAKCNVFPCYRLRQIPYTLKYCQLIHQRQLATERRVFGDNSTAEFRGIWQNLPRKDCGPANDPVLYI